MDTQNLSSMVFSSIRGVKKLLIVVKGSPDPDVLASSYALKLICQTEQVEATIVSMREVSLPQNKAMIQRLEIPVHFIKKIYSPADYDAYAVLDHQSAWVDDIGIQIPCALHIDHHTQEKDRISPKVRILSEEAGSVSTIMSIILKDRKIDINPIVMKRLATALLLGIKTDTDALQHAGEIDLNAADWLLTLVDPLELSEMESIPYSEETITVISKAVMNEYFYKDWVFCGVGFIAEEYRDSIAITADYLLQNEDVSGAAVFALIEKKKGSGLYLDTSIRTRHKTMDLNRFVKFISSDGGGRSYKGAYQVNLDYFTTCPDRGLLWECIRLSTMERLKRGRDHITALAIEGAFNRVRKKVSRIFE